MFGLSRIPRATAVLAVAAGVIVTLAGAPAQAGALHGQCNGTGIGTCSDNGTNTPLGNSTTFNFTISPGPQTGDLMLAFLIPNGGSTPSPFSVTEVAPNSGTTFSTTQHSGQWTSGALDTFLGLSGYSPNNPIGAYLPTTQTYDPSATGFYLYEADIGNITIPENSAGITGTPSFDVVNSLPLGSYVVAFFENNCVTKKGKTTCNDVATANSGALLYNVSNPPSQVPEPASLALLSSALVGFGLLRRRKA